VDGFYISPQPLELYAIARARFDANEIDEPEILISLGRDMGTSVAMRSACRRIGDHAGRVCEVLLLRLAIG
jgi:hypothetical protein